MLIDASFPSQADLFRPKILICGSSAYPRDWDYARLRGIADRVGALLMCDMAHISGLVATKCVNDPFPHCHIVTTTTHKSLRGPRSGLIFFRKDKELDLENRINFAVFPSLQGGPHNNAIAGVATQLKVVMTDDFKEYSKQVIKNSQAIAATLTGQGYKLATGGTDNHLVLWDLRPQEISGNKLELVCDECSITLNKNSINGDKSALSPGGVRIGAPALTTRGMKEKDFEIVGQFLIRALKICEAIQASAGSKKLSDFQAHMADHHKDIEALKADVEAFSENFPMPGIP